MVVTCRVYPLSHRPESVRMVVHGVTGYTWYLCKSPEVVATTAYRDRTCVRIARSPGPTVVALFTGDVGNVRYHSPP